MTLEAILSYLHLLAILTAVVFLSSTAALCRAEWINAAAVRRLRTVDRIYWIAMAAIAVTGLVRWLFGIKGAGWYAGNWLLWAKIVLFLAIGALSVPASRAFAAWNARLASDGALPPDEEITRARRLVMRAGHILPLIPLPAVFLARGFG
jgi:putative membrane protein